MASFYQDQHSLGSRQSQGNSSSPVDVVLLGQQIDTLIAQVDALEQRKRAEYEAQQRQIFEDMVFYKLSDIQARFDAITDTHDEEERQKKLFEADMNQTLNQIDSQVDLRTTRIDTTLMIAEMSLRAKMDQVMEKEDQIGAKICKFLQAELAVTEKNIVTHIEQRLKAIEDRNIQRLEEFSAKTACMLENIAHKKFEDLEYSIEAVSCQVQRLEDRMEKEMEQLFHGMYKDQGDLQETESEDDWFKYQTFENALPGYIDDLNEGEVNKGSLEVGGDPIYPEPCLEHEQFLRDDIIASRDSYEPVQEQPGDMEGIEEWNYMACTPVQERDVSMGADLPYNQEDDSLPPAIIPCSYSCEIACTPQVKACFGVLASSVSREESQYSSWEDKASSMDFEDTKGQSRTIRQGVTQVWLPKGTLEVMKVFNLTEINVGEKACVQHKTKKRKRRRKSPDPQSGIG